MLSKILRNYLISKKSSFGRKQDQNFGTNHIICADYKLCQYVSIDISFIDYSMTGLWTRGFSVTFVGKNACKNCQ